MSDGKTIVFFPEAAFGPALNSVGIAQVCRDMGHRPVFLADPGFSGVFADYGFEEHAVPMSEPMEPEAMARYWSDFINGQIPNFHTPPIEQVSTYIKACWEAIVETAVWAEKSLPGVLAKVEPDLICVDNVVLFPATKRHGAPWVRIISCSENEIEDPDIPPHLSGCREDDPEGFRLYREAFEREIAPIHAQFNEFLAACGEELYPLGQFFETSPWLNLLHYPRPLAFHRRHPLDEERFVYLEGCIREEDPYAIPDFAVNQSKPLVYVSFGSLGSGDTDLMKRLMATLGTLPFRVLVNVGDYGEAYDHVPPNCHVDSWYPQPSVIAEVDAVIHHGGNNSFNECLYFGKPSLIMPYCWDGHDNATHIDERGYGLAMERYTWKDADIAAALERMVSDTAMKQRLESLSAHMQAEDGRRKGARALDNLLRTGA